MPVSKEDLQTGDVSTKNTLYRQYNFARRDLSPILLRIRKAANGGKESGLIINAYDGRYKIISSDIAINYVAGQKKLIKSFALKRI